MNERLGMVTSGSLDKGVEVKLPDGGTVYKVVYDIDAEEARSWLAEQLKIERSAILQGELRV
jgi:hypothetical protein